MGWWITLGILVCLVILPLGIRIRYNSEGQQVKLLLGTLRFTLVPAKKKEKKKKPEKKQETPKEEQPEKPDIPPKPKQKPEKKKESGGSVLDFLPLLDTVLDFLGDFRRKLRINNLEMKLIMAGDDPCDLATNYGRAWAALGNLMPKLEQWFVIKKRNVEVECDFTASETLIIAGMDISITFGRLVAALARFGFRAVREFLKINKKRKGGAKQ